MELFTLDSNRKLGAMIENYTSLVWTERYNTAGDFELVTSDVERALAAMPLESFVTLRDSTVPMVVEVHKIDNEPQNAPTITITGRSFESVLERRASVNALPLDTARVAWTITAAKESDAAYKAIRVVIGDIDRTRTDNSQPLASEVAMGELVLPAMSPAISALDAIPEINLVLPKDYSSLSPNTYEIPAQDLYATVLNLIQSNGRGIKAVRPTTASKTTFDIEIYNGADMTQLVVFDARFDQFESSTYLLSRQGMGNIAYVYGPNGSDIIYRNAVDVSHPEPSGLTRRVFAIDGTSDDTMNSYIVRKSRGISELYQHNPTALFDGETSMQVAAGYNSRYFLGDLLLLVGEYGLSNVVRVTEFIRSSDTSGEQAYPAFEVVG